MNAREWCAATQSSARAGGQPRVAREFSSSGPRVLPPGAQPRLSQCGSRGLCAFNPYVFLNTISAIYVGYSTREIALAKREAEQPRGVETTLSSDGQFCAVNTCVCGTRRRRYRVRRAEPLPRAAAGARKRTARASGRQRENLSREQACQTQSRSQSQQESAASRRQSERSSHEMARFPEREVTRVQEAA